MLRINRVEKKILGGSMLGVALFCLFCAVVFWLLAPPTKKIYQKIANEDFEEISWISKEELEFFRLMFEEKNSEEEANFKEIYSEELELFKLMFDD
jgi:hypothetical protein